MQNQISASCHSSCKCNNHPLRLILKLDRFTAFDALGGVRDAFRLALGRISPSQPLQFLLRRSAEGIDLVGILVVQFLQAEGAARRELDAARDGRGILETAPKQLLLFGCTFEMTVTNLLEGPTRLVVNQRKGRIICDIGIVEIWKSRDLVDMISFGTGECVNLDTPALPMSLAPPSSTPVNYTTTADTNRILHSH